MHTEINRPQTQWQRLAPFGHAFLATIAMYFLFNIINVGGKFSLDLDFLIEFSLAYLHVFAVLLGIEGFEKFFNRRFGAFDKNIQRYFWEVWLILILNALIFTIIYLAPMLLLTMQKSTVFNTDLLQIRIRQSYIITSILVLLLYGSKKVFGLYNHLRFTEMEAERIKKERAMHQFETLKNQVNPHFLFNSLNALSSLISIDKDQAARFVDELSIVYRYVLDQKDNELVKLRKEITFIESYLHLLEVRYRKSLQCTIAIEAQYFDLELPPLSLQLLIDNAIQYNSMQKEQPLYLHFEVVNQMLLFKHNEQPRSQINKITALGLNDLIARFEYLSELRIKTWRENGQFLVQIPLLKIDT